MEVRKGKIASCNEKQRFCIRERLSFDFIDVTPCFTSDQLLISANVCQAVKCQPQVPMVVSWYTPGSTNSIRNMLLDAKLSWDDGYHDVDEDEYIDESRALVYARLNKEHPQHAAKCKILMSHPHLDMKTFLRWDLKFLPLAVAWFERAKPCTTLTIRNSKGRVLLAGESDEAFQSRVLTAMYLFVRERSTDVLGEREALISEAWKDKIAMAEEEIKRFAKDKESLLKDYNRPAKI